MSNSNDLRVLKTKKKLVSALNELMEKSPLVDITVFDLCQAANIRRATFYKHFSDKTDFLTYYMTIIEDGIFEKINSLKATGGPTHYYTSYVRELMRCLCDHETVLRGLIESDSLHLVMNIILSGTLESLKKDLAEDVENGLILPTELDTVALFLNGGLCQILVDWFLTRSISEEELVNRVRVLIDKIIK